MTNARLRPAVDGHVAPFTSQPPPVVRDWKPTTAQRRRLRHRGRALLDARLAVYGLSPAEGDTLMRACEATDEAAFWRKRSRAVKDPTAAIKAGRLALLYDREAANALALLREK